MNNNILGVDPGVRGGLAVIFVDANGAAPQLIDAIDIPVTGVGAKERVDVLAIRDWVVQHAPQHALIERGQAMPKQGASSGFKYGRAVGAIEAVIACCGIPLTIIEPTVWKKFHQLRGGDKEAGRQRALQLFPTAHELLAHKKDHGRTEAALIALSGLHQINRNRISAQAGIAVERIPTNDETIQTIEQSAALAERTKAIDV